MWTTVAKLEELNEYQPRRVVVDGEGYVLFQSNEQIYCLQDQCSHAEVPLSMGTFDRKSCTVTCPQHGAKFDVRDGKALSMPAVSPVSKIPVQIVDGSIQIDVEE